MSENILSVFEKHIGKQQNLAQNTKVIKTIKDTNSIIGALQTIDLALKKCLNSLEQPKLIEEIVSKCSFMGEALFGVEISIPLIGESFYIEKPQDLLQCNSSEDVGHFLADKREEIKGLLQCIFESLNQEDNDYAMPHTQQISLEKFF